MSERLRRNGLTKKLFEAFDGDSSGFVDVEEFEEIKVSQTTTSTLWVGRNLYNDVSRVVGRRLSQSQRTSCEQVLR